MPMITAPTAMTSRMPAGWLSNFAVNSWFPTVARRAATEPHPQCQAHREQPEADVGEATDREPSADDQPLALVPWQSASSTACTSRHAA